MHRLAVDLNRDNYDSEVFQSKSPIMVDFWGPSCQPCLALMPAVEKLEKEHAGKIKVAKVNAAENRMLCARLRVLGLPSFLFYKDGVEVNRICGQHISESDIIKAVASIIDW
ncbi:thioredoxin family protein [Chloroflexota bacterium]